MKMIGGSVAVADGTVEAVGVSVRVGVHSGDGVLPVVGSLALSSVVIPTRFWIHRSKKPPWVKRKAGSTTKSKPRNTTSVNGPIRLIIRWITLAHPASFKSVSPIYSLMISTKGKSYGG
jgi:hypothetical protein